MSKRFVSWLRDLFRTSGPPLRNRKALTAAAQKCPQRRRCPVWAEQLEDRCVPASFQFQDLLLAPGPEQVSSFGFAVAIDGDIAVVGEPFSNNGAGAVYVFGRNDQGTPVDQSDDTWDLQVRLTASNAETNDRFGISVAISGGVIVVGAEGESSAATGVNG